MVSFFKTVVEGNILLTNILFDWLGVSMAGIEMLSATLEMDIIDMVI